MMYCVIFLIMNLFLEEEDNLVNNRLSIKTFVFCKIINHISYRSARDVVLYGK